jgi:hypothetical protein
MVLAVAATAASAGPAFAYIGPGAGMEYIGQFMALLAMIGVAFLSVLTWPFYAFIRWWRGPKAPAPAPVPETAAATPPVAPAPAVPAPDQAAQIPTTPGSV